MSQGFSCAKVRKTGELDCKDLDLSQALWARFPGAGGVHFGKAQCCK